MLFMSYDRQGNNFDVHNWRMRQLQLLKDQRVEAEKNNESITKRSHRQKHPLQFQAVIILSHIQLYATDMWMISMDNNVQVGCVSFCLLWW